MTSSYDEFRLAQTEVSSSGLFVMTALALEVQDGLAHIYLIYGTPKNGRLMIYELEIKRYTKALMEQKDYIEVLEKRIKDKDKLYLEVVSENKVLLLYSSD